MATVSRYETRLGETRWRVRYRTPDNRQTDKRGFKTKRDAEAFLIDVEGRKRRGEYVSQSAGKALLGDLGAEWLKRQQGHLKPNSYRSIESRWRVHVNPRWQRTPAAKVAYTDVQAWISELGTKSGAKLVRSVHSVLLGILEDAVRDRRIPSNPARGVKLPTIVKQPNKYLTAEQLADLAIESGRYGSLVMLLGTVGLRWGEAAGLRVSDIDFSTGSLRVVDNATAGTVGSPKGNRYRIVYAAPTIVADLELVAAGKDSNDLMWPSATGGHLKAPATHDSWLSGAVKRCQKLYVATRARERAENPRVQPRTPAFPRITARNLRDTAASLAISGGANIKGVQRMLGHASAAMTLDVYADLFDDDLVAVAGRLEEIVGKVWAKKSASRPNYEKNPL